MEWVDPPFVSGHWGPELVEIAGQHHRFVRRKHQPSAQIEWQQVLDARPEIMTRLRFAGYDIDRARHDHELLRRFPGFWFNSHYYQSGECPRGCAAHISRAYNMFSSINSNLEILAGFLHPTEFAIAFRTDLTTRA